MSLEAALQATAETNLQLISVLNQFLSHFKELKSGAPAQAPVVYYGVPSYATPEATPAEHAQATVATNGASSPSAPVEEHNNARAEAAAEQAVSVPPTPDTAGVTPPTYKKTADAVTSLHKAKGVEAAKKVLALFDAKTLKDISPDRFAEVIAACQAERGES